MALSEEDILLNYRDAFVEIAWGGLIKLTRVWNNMYSLNNDQLQNLCDKFLHHNKNLIEDMIRSQLDKQKILQDDISSLFKERSMFERELNLEISIQNDKIVGQPLCNQKEYLEQTLKLYKALKDERLEKLAVLKSKMSDLVDILGMDALDISTNVIPTEEQLEEYSKKIAAFDNEKNKRIDSMATIKSSLLDLISNLEIPASDVDEWPLEVLKILKQPEKEWILSKSNIQLIKNFSIRLENNLDKAVKKKTILVAELQSLWNRISEGINHQKNFIDQCHRCGTLTFDKIDHEIERCKEICRQNIKPLTENLREEIKSMWETLMYSPEECELFKEFNCTEMSEYILEAHEKYLAGLKEYFVKYKDLYLLMGERCKLWNTWVDLETRTLDKNRFNNRGGQLLKEERERKIVEKKLPKLEREIISRAETYFQIEGKLFLWNGRLPSDIIDESRRELEALKDLTKTTKKEDSDHISLKREKLLTPLKNNVNTIRNKKSCIVSSHSKKIQNETFVMRPGPRGNVYLSPSIQNLMNSDNENMTLSSYSNFQGVNNSKNRTPLSAVNQRDVFKHGNCSNGDRIDNSTSISSQITPVNSPLPDIITLSPDIDSVILINSSSDDGQL